VNSFWGKFTLVLFVLIQCLDGIYTYFGVKIWGYEIEGNPIVRSLMPLIGSGLGLTVAKVLVVGCGIFIYRQGYYKILGLLTVFYVIFVIIPWRSVFFSF